MISALVTAGIDGGYLTNPRRAKVHWQAAGRPLPEPWITVAGESGLWVDPAEIPADLDIARLGRALAAGRRGDRDMPYLHVLGRGPAARYALPVRDHFASRRRAHTGLVMYARWPTG